MHYCFMRSDWFWLTFCHSYAWHIGSVRGSFWPITVKPSPSYALVLRTAAWHLLLSESFIFLVPSLEIQTRFSQP